MVAVTRKPGLVQVGLVVLGVVVLVVGGAMLFRGRAKANGDHGATEAAPATNLLDITVKTVRPRVDKNFQLTVVRPADVEAYYRALIESRVAGEVQSIKVATGSRVTKGQQLVRIFVPDLLAAEREKRNVVSQRERELRLTDAKLGAARAAVNTALANVEEKKTLLTRAKAETKFRDLQFQRFDKLFRDNAVDRNVRDEAEKNLEVARSAEVAADAARIKADSEVEDARANVKVFEAEVERMKQLIEVAKSDDEEAQALVNFATVKAPFNGTVVARKVDPGSFVQNASTGHPTPLMALERTDIVTVAMRVPDNYAPFVDEGTEAVIQLDSLPGVKIHGKVTRFSSSLVTDAHDRTMRVEVDLWNRSAAAFKKFVAEPANLADLKEGPLPLVPEVSGSDALQRRNRLMAGMYGKMTLVLKSFGDTKLIPSQAIVRHGGRAYIYIVKDGAAHLIPVEVRVDDGRLAKVDLLGEDGEVLGGLTGDEEIIVSNQEELTEGQPVKTTPAKE